MVSNDLTVQRITIGNETLERVREYTYGIIRKTLSANSTHERKTRRIEMGWSVLCILSYHE